MSLLIAGYSIIMIYFQSAAVRLEFLLYRVSSINEGKISGSYSARMDIRSLGLQCSAVMMASSSRTASSTVSLMTK